MTTIPPVLMREPTVAIVTKAKGTFFKPLYEAFAQAQPAGWKTVLAWPAGRRSEHPDESVTPKAANLEVCSVPCRTFSIRRRGNCDRNFLPSRALWRLLASRDVRAVLIHEYSLYTLGALLFAKWRRIPIVVSSEIGKRNRQYFSAATRLWHSFWGRFADGFVACAPAAREPLCGGTRPTIAAYHAVDSRIYLPPQKPAGVGSPIVFAYLGQLIQRKGIDLLLKAAARLRDEGADGFRIRLIGGGDEQWVLGWIRELRLEAMVELTGFLSGPAIRDALGSADVFVLPTRQDTYAAVVHEAACLVLPLLVSQHAGAAEVLVSDGRNGFVFEPEDTEKFAVLMRKLMETGLRESMGTISRSTAESLSAHVRGKALWEWLAHTFTLSA
ncbi:MAG: glycosyltransferase [Verrucomicrobiota bacterium]